MRILPFLLLAALFLSDPAFAETPKDNPKCKPSPLFNRFAGESLYDCEHSRYQALSLYRRKDPNDPQSDLEDFSVEGEYWYNFNELAPGASGLPGKLEVRRNFETAIANAKGKALYADEGSGAVHFHIKRPDGEFWGAVGCGRGDGTGCSAVFYKIVRVEVMKQEIVLSADQIAKAMDDEGKVVFYGLYFDTDKAILKPASAPTLAEMAKWLKENAEANVYIVGHTDMQGSVDHNRSLSQNRAIAVVEALIKTHGIKKERLGAEGVGPFSPVAANNAEAGRAKNRRVEMVLR